jgi:hypothetical protein
MAEVSGRLTVVSEPSNITLWVDGQLMGQTPLLQRSFPIGRHTVQLVDQVRQLSETRTVEIVEDSAVVLNVTLQKDYGTLTVNSKPDSAEVFLLTRVGKTPVTDDQIVPGAYTVEVRHPNRHYLVTTDHITIEKNKTWEIEKSLARQKLFTTKAWWQIGLGAASVGSYIWCWESGNRDWWDNGVFGFTLGTLCLVGVEIIALF